MYIIMEDTIFPRLALINHHHSNESASSSGGLRLDLEPLTLTDDPSLATDQGPIPGLFIYLFIYSWFI